MPWQARRNQQPSPPGGDAEVSWLDAELAVPTRRIAKAAVWLFAFAHGWQILAHVSGDAAIDQYIGAVRAAAAKYGKADRRPEETMLAKKPLACAASDACFGLASEALAGAGVVVH